MKIGYLGAGTWGFCLARLLAMKGFEVISWSISKELVEELNRTKTHPQLANRQATGNIRFTTDINEAVDKADILIESVTTQGIRPVFESIKSLKIPKNIPICLTSKGIEQNSGMILSDVVIDILGEESRNQIASLSGPSFAEEVSRQLPTAVVVASYNQQVATLVADVFTTPFFRVYSSNDVRGVAFGGALKNVIAIACGISDGLNLGTGAKAALMTRGLHEIVRLSKMKACRGETLYGLSGMGDLFLTCSSSNSRNWRFGKYLSEGHSSESAKKIIGMVVEGSYSCLSALQISNKLGIEMPICSAVQGIVDGSISAMDAVNKLMNRGMKEETE